MQNFLAFLSQSDLRTVTSFSFLIYVTSLGDKQDPMPILQIECPENKSLYIALL